THELEKRFNEAALALDNKSASTAAETRSLLQAVYVDDDQFRADFEVFRQTTSSKGKKVIRYILCELERQNTSQDLNWSTATATIEHLLPENLDDHWASIFSEDEHLRYVDRLGNFALLEFGKNKELGQKSFTDKRTVLETSQYSLTKDIAAFEEWTPATISERQRNLARLATSVWRFP
ncbi:MAG: HNH endonuclease family protein, partial [Opitutales bacterium]